MNSTSDPASGRHRLGIADTDALLRRLRLFSAFAHLDERARRAVLAAGEVLDLRSGDAVCVAGQHSPNVHHLLEGTLAIRTGDGGSLLLRAGEGPAREALDEAGAKTATIVAAPSARVFRIDADKLAAALAAADAEPVPTADYTDTFSGQQLARLVGELRTEHQDLGNPVAARTAATERLLGERTMGFEIAAADLESTRPPPVLTEAVAESPDLTTTITRGFEAELRRQVADIRAAETARANSRLRAYAEKLKQQAETQLRAKMKTLGSRYESAYQAREQALRKRYEQLMAQANRLARQKAVLYEARHRHRQQLERSAGLQQEFAALTTALIAQIDDVAQLPSLDDEVGAVPPLESKRPS